MLSLEISLIPEELQISEFQSTDLLMMHLNGHPAYIRIPPMPENLFMFEVAVITLDPNIKEIKEQETSNLSNVSQLVNGGI